MRRWWRSIQREVRVKITKAIALRVTELLADGQRPGEAMGNALGDFADGKLKGYADRYDREKHDRKGSA